MEVGARLEPNRYFERSAGEWFFPVSVGCGTHPPFMHNVMPHEAPPRPHP